MSTIRLGRRRRWLGIAAAAAVGVTAGSVGLTSALGGQAGTGDATSFVPIEPCRILDTRPEFNVGASAVPLGVDDTLTLSAHGVSGDCDISPTVVGLSLNVTAVGATAPTFVTVFPAGSERPNSSNLNPGPGDFVTANAVTVLLSSAGNFSIYNAFGSVDAVVDLVGVYVPVEAAGVGPTGPAGPAGADGADGADGAAPTAWYADVDGDTFGDGETLVIAVDAPVGHVADDGDCDDTDPGVNPDALDVFGDGIDASCSDLDGDGVPDVIDECIEHVSVSSDFGGLLVPDVINTVAGLDTPDDSGDGCLASLAGISNARGLATFDGDLYVADLSNHRVRRIDRRTGVISTVAGTGVDASTGDGGPATAAAVSEPHDIAFASDGTMYISENGTNSIRAVDPGTGVISTVTPVTGALAVTGLTLVGDETLYVADGGDEIFEIDLSGAAPVVTSLVGGFNTVRDVATLPDGNLVAADSEGNRVYHVDVSGPTVTTLAGTGSAGAGADGIDATTSALNKPYGVDVDRDGNVVIAGFIANDVRVVDMDTGLIDTLAGTGAATNDGDFGAPLDAGLRRAIGVHADPSGNVWVTTAGLGTPPVDDNWIRVIGN